MVPISMLTTVDNPYDPFTDFNNWFGFDVQSGYNTCAYLARVAKASPSLSDSEYSEAIDDAINKIVLMDPTNKYKKVVKNT